MDNFRQSANNLVAVKQSMSIEVRRKFLFGDWASPPADMTSEERIAAAKGLELNTTGGWVGMAFTTPSPPLSFHTPTPIAYRLSPIIMRTTVTPIAPLTLPFPMLQYAKASRTMMNYFASLKLLSR